LIELRNNEKNWNVFSRLPIAIVYKMLSLVYCISVADSLRVLTKAKRPHLCTIYCQTVFRIKKWQLNKFEKKNSAGHL
jgi:hypothetical protein